MVRDDKGRFATGNGGGPGRPKREREVEYYRIMQTACSKADWAAIVDKAVKQARGGDSVARKFLADYLIGPPVERKEVTGADGKAFIIQLSWGDNADADAED